LSLPGPRLPIYQAPKFTQHSIMSTPQKAPKASRRPVGKGKVPIVPNCGDLTTRGAVSESELSQPQIPTKNAPVSSEKHPRRKSQASNKKPNGATHRGTASDNIPFDKAKSTPIKQAYAGPTFHQSPAASALPMPSFYSKSVPSASAVKPSTQAITEQNDLDARGGFTNKEDSPTKRETTPLDFLFEAAKKARDTPRGQSPSHLSVRTGSPASRSPAPREADSVFPFELDGASNPGEDGSPFATPYKDRMESLRAFRHSSESALSMDESERLAKTDALKRLLIKSAGSHSGAVSDHNNPFNARIPQNANQLVSPQPQIRHRSGPSTPSYMQSYQNNNRSDQYFPRMPQPYNDSPHHAAYRVSSNLRVMYGAESEPEPAELSSDSAISPPRISTARKPSLPISPPAHLPFRDQVYPISPTNHVATHRATPSIQQMEDEMRRVLKLDLTGRV
jgi:Proline-rich nuclear receptor coactivator motif